MLKKIIKHIILVSKHKWVVFKLCTKVGIPLQGIVHDISKFSYTEFSESVKYYTGRKSPIVGAREAQGYSKAYYHHKRNKHHIEYWLDLENSVAVPVIPYKYALEMVCDNLAAGIVYNGKNWKQDTQLKYWLEQRKRIIINPKLENFFTTVFTEVKEKGIDKTLIKSNMKKIYQEYCIDDKTEYIYEFKGEWKKIEERKDVI